jgi:prolyl-tRNA editing enzyme YbaK/EbsC (Cys-tRNA(Pro) deacylase)
MAEPTLLSEVLNDHDAAEDVLRSMERIDVLYKNYKVSKQFMKRFYDIAKEERSSDQLATKSSLVRLSNNQIVFNDTASIPEEVQRIIHEAKEKSLLLRLYQVEPQYYEWTLLKRAIRLHAPSQHHLCKSVLFENTRYNTGHDDEIPLVKEEHEKYMTDPLNSKYYLVVVQYTSKLNTQRMMNFVRGLKDNSVPRKNFNFRLANEQVSELLTGFKKGGVTPLALQSNIPVFVEKGLTLLQPPICFLGAGHIDWKLSIPVKDLVSYCDAKVVDIS